MPTVPTVTGGAIVIIRTEYGVQNTRGTPGFGGPSWVLIILTSAHPVIYVTLPQVGIPDLPSVLITGKVYILGVPGYLTRSMTKTSMARIRTVDLVLGYPRICTGTQVPYTLC